MFYQVTRRLIPTFHIQFRVQYYLPPNLRGRHSERYYYFIQVENTFGNFSSVINPIHNINHIPLNCSGLSPVHYIIHCICIMYIDNIGLDFTWHVKLNRS